MSVFSYIDYRSYLNNRIQNNQNVFGYKSRLAEAAGCQRSFFSQVLAGAVHLTPEHAVGLTQFWNLSRSEGEYFVGLVNYARAGTPALREHIKDRLAELKQGQEDFSNRLQEKSVLAEGDAAFYYSGWQYTAVHMLLTVPAYQRLQPIAKRLQVSEEFAEKTLKTLEAVGLAVRDGDRWLTTNKSIHLSRDSHFNSLNHANWRNRAVNNSYAPLESDIHYTAVFSLSHEDWEKLRQMVFRFIDDSRKIIHPSKEEEVLCMTCDLFRA